MSLNKIQKSMLGQDVQDEFNKMGVLTQLQTTDKSSLVNAINEHSASLAEKATRLSNLVVDVKADYGAKGDGVTDDTTAIQNAINAVVKMNGGRLFFPAGTYKITNYINIPFGTGFIIEGLTRGNTVIKQFTDNTPIFRFTTALTHSWIIRNIDFEYNNSQPSANNLSVPIYFALDSGSGPSGYYNFQIESCTFNSGYYAISQKTDSQQISLWGLQIRNCIFGGSLSGWAINLTPNPSNGQPVISIENCYINCGNMLSPAINISSSDTVLLKSVEFNSGTYTATNQISITSCPNVTLMNCRSEQATIGGSYSLWSFPQSIVEVIGCTVTGITINASSAPTMLNAGTSGRMSVRGLNVAPVIGSGATCTALYSDNLLAIENVIVSGGAIRYSTSSIPKLDMDNTQQNKTTNRGDVSITLTSTDNPYQYFNTSFTANRNVSLPSAGLYDGLTFTIISRNTAAFTLTIIDPVSGKNLTIPASTKARVTYRAVGSGEWVCTDYSTGIA